VNRIRSVIEEIKPGEIFFNPRTESTKLKMGNAFPDYELLKDMPFWHIPKYAEVRSLLAAGWDRWGQHVDAHQDSMQALAAPTGNPLEYVCQIRGQTKAMAWDDNSPNLLAFRQADVIVLEAGNPDMVLRAKGCNPSKVLD
jgi:hypothetical protein